MTGKQDGKGKINIFGVDDSTESEYWTQSASAGSEEGLHFCCMENCDKFENFEEVVTDGNMENSEEALMENSEKIVIDEKNVLNLTA